MPWSCLQGASDTEFYIHNYYWVDISKLLFKLKGKLGDFFYWLKVFIGPKLREVSKGNFHRKAPK